MRYSISEDTVLRSYFLCSIHDRLWNFTTMHRRVESSLGCDSVVLCFLLPAKTLDPYLAISFKQFADITFDLPEKGKHSTWFGKIWMLHPVLGGIYKSKTDQMPAHVSFLPWRLAGTLRPEGSGGLSWFPHWFRHQTGQGWVGILRWVESTQKSRRHEKWNGMHKMKTRQSFQL